MRALERRQLTLDQRRRGAFAARFDALEEVALQIFPVGDEALDVRVLRIGLRNLVEQVERATGCGSKIGDDGGDDAAGGAGDDEHAVAGEREAACAVDRRLLLQADAPPLPGFVANLDHAGIA